MTSSFDLVQFMAGLLVGVSSCMLFKALGRRSVSASAPLAAASVKSGSQKKKLPSMKIDDDLKMVVLVRTDLNMAKGKTAAQCCHAVLAAFQEAQRKTPQLLEAWEETGQAKVTLKIDSQEELIQLVGKAREYGLCAQTIRDAGRTQVAAGTMTVGAIGPGPAKLIDLVTGHLKLY